MNSHCMNNWYWIGLLVAIEVLAVVFGGWSGLEGGGDWGKVPPTIPVIIFSLVYHDLAPGKKNKQKIRHILIFCLSSNVNFIIELSRLILSTDARNCFWFYGKRFLAVLCAYLEGDLQRIRASVLLGSVVPLLALLVWDAIALNLSSQSDHQVADPVELLIMR